VHIDQIACGDEHTLCRSQDGRVYGWGANVFGQLGEPASADADGIVTAPREITSLWNVPLSPSTHQQSGRARPEPVVTGGTITHIAAAGSTSYFVKDSHTSTEVFACGFGQFGELGTGKNVHVATRPLRVRQLSLLQEYDEQMRRMCPIRVAQLVAGPHHAFAVLQNRAAEERDGPSCDVLAWGSNLHGECMQGGTKLLNAPCNAEAPVVEAAVHHKSKNIQLASKSKRFQLHSSTKEQPSSWTNWAWAFGRTQNNHASLERIACGPGVTAFY
jgi:alpha-tubulin suppressor-like RCC1 family protein